MSHISGENVQSMPAVITMPSRRSARAIARVLTMPSHVTQPSNVVMLPAPSERSSEAADRTDHRSAIRSGFGALSEGVRMTLVALFALLGWPHPTRDNDPGPSAARPCHWERTNLVSRLWLPSNDRKAAAASIKQFAADKVADKAMLRAA